MRIRDTQIAVVGLGYVGLPLAASFGRHFRTTGFDVKAKRINELTEGIDRTGELTAEELAAAGNLSFTTDPTDLRECSIVVVAVPTPIDARKAPDLRPLLAATKSVGSVLSEGATVVYESTVYPGATEEECVPILEQESGLVFNRDFFVGYSPERINPGDREHRIESIVKVVAGSTPETADLLCELYGTIVTAGVHRASSIRVAEAAKVIENTQRDLNIALVNELAQIFHRLDIDTTEVLEAAGTKWNFLPFRPGLVGGHCIGVDPYYLTYKAQEVGHHPEIILAGRRLNDSVGGYLAAELVKLMIKRGVAVAHARVLVLGIAFKENCPDIRNTRVVDVVRELSEYGCEVSIYDPWAEPDEVREEHGIELLQSLEVSSDPARADGPFDACLLAVAHREFRELDPRSLVAEHGVVYDAKSLWPKDKVDRRL